MDSIDSDNPESPLVTEHLLQHMVILISARAKELQKNKKINVCVCVCFMAECSTREYMRGKQPYGATSCTC